MRVLLQRVLEAEVRVAGSVVGEIGHGLLLLVGFAPSDGETELSWMAKKCASLRVFSDEQGKMNLDVRDVQGDVLVVSQFTLYGTVHKGNRPSFVGAGPPEVAEALYQRFVARISEEVGRPVPTGRFGAEMQVRLVNDGPVTLWLDR